MAGQAPWLDRLFGNRGLRSALFASGAFLLAALGAHADEMTFVDEWCCGDIVAYGQASALLTASHPPDLKSEPDYQGSPVRYATLLLADVEGKDVPVVVAVVGRDGEMPILYVDGNADGVLTQDERAPLAEGDLRPPGFGKEGKPVWTVRLANPDDYAMAVRLGSTGQTVLCAVRGYARGSIPTVDGPRDAIVVDADADAAFDVGSDPVYVDVDGNGAFEPRGERFPLLSPFEVAAPPIEFPSPMPMRSAVWRKAPTGRGQLAVALPGIAAKPTRLMVSLSREGGGAYMVRDVDRAVEVPVGSYSVGSAFLEFAGDDGPPWVFSFTRADPPAAAEVQAGADAHVDLLAGLHVVVACPPMARAGDEVSVGVGARTESGLELQRCARGDMADRTAQRTPQLTIAASSGTVLVRTTLEYG